MHKLTNRIYALGLVSMVALWAIVVCLVLASPAVYVGFKAYQHKHQSKGKP